MHFDILIVGGVAAGLSAASRARKLAPRARIAVLERGTTAAYGACGLPYYLGGQVEAPERLLAHPLEFFRQARGLELLTGHEALEIEPGRRRVRVRHGAEESWFGYAHLVLATGARPAWQPPGDGLRNVFAANTWDQVAGLRAALQAEPPRRLAVVGAGYIGLEVAEALRRRGLDVTLVEAGGTLLPNFDPDFAQRLEPHLAQAGIRICLATRVAALSGPKGGRVLALETDRGSIETDAVVNCAGLLPETRLAAAAGIRLGRFDGIDVDDRQQTSLNGVWAAGDCAETRHLVTGSSCWIPLGAAANKQGRVAGQNAAGATPARFPGVLGTLAVPLFGCEIGRTGLSLAQAQASGLDCATEIVDSADSANYMPTPRRLSLKIVYQPTTGRLLGCHLLGECGTVAGRLNAAAVALSAALRLDQIEALDLAYSPALAPLYEPLLIAAHNALRR